MSCLSAAPKTFRLPESQDTIRDHCQDELPASIKKVTILNLSMSRFSLHTYYSLAVENVLTRLPNLAESDKPQRLCM
jgi:hypothetical protein